jgi:hypothetical protein
VLGSFKGTRDGKAFTLPLRGTVNKQNMLTLNGSKNDTEIKLTGKLSAKGADGNLSGKVYGKPFRADYKAPK